MVGNTPGVFVAVWILHEPVTRKEKQEEFTLSLEQRSSLLLKSVRHENQRCEINSNVEGLNNIGVLEWFFDSTRYFGRANNIIEIQTNCFQFVCYVCCNVTYENLISTFNSVYIVVNLTVQVSELSNETISSTVTIDKLVIVFPVSTTFSRLKKRNRDSPSNAKRKYLLPFCDYHRSAGIRQIH